VTFVRFVVKIFFLRTIAAILTADSDEGQRLRQSTPFPGVLSKEEREEIFARCEKGIFD
jgi:hypothetical protein